MQKWNKNLSPDREKYEYLFSPSANGSAPLGSQDAVVSRADSVEVGNQSRTVLMQLPVTFEWLFTETSSVLGSGNVSVTCILVLYV